MKGERLVISTEKFYISTHCVGNIRTYGDLKKMEWRGINGKTILSVKIIQNKQKSKQTKATVKGIFINNLGWVLKVHGCHKNISIIT